MLEHPQRSIWALALALLSYLLCCVVNAAAPAEWTQDNIQQQQFTMGIMARVHKDGTAVKNVGAMLAVFLDNELRGVATYDNNDGLYFFNLSVAAKSTGESGYAFKYYDPTDDTVYDLLVPIQHSPLTFNELGYGGFSEETLAFEPFVLSLPGVPTIAYTLTPADAADAGAQWRIDGGAWNNSGVPVETTPGIHAISFKDVAGYKTPVNQTITLAAGDEKTGLATYDSVFTFHPADFADEDGKEGGDGVIDSFEYQKYAAPVKKIALGAYEYTWDGVNVMSITKDTGARGIADFAQTRSDISIERIVSFNAAFTPGRTLTVTLRITGADQLLMISLVERIPQGWTVVEANEENFVPSSGRFTISDESGKIKDEYTYHIVAPTDNLADEYAISSFNSTCYTPFEGDSTRFTAGSTTLTRFKYHPADFEDEDGNEGGDGIIESFKYQKYAAPVKRIAMGAYEYTWDGVDVMSITKKTDVRGIAKYAQTRSRASIERIVSPDSTFTAGQTLTVTLRITGADQLLMVSLVERIPEGWSVLEANEDNYVPSSRRFTIIDESGSIQDEYTYHLVAPANDLADEYEFSSFNSTCYTPFEGDTTRFSAGNTRLSHVSDPIEWPENLEFYSPAYGKVFREKADCAAVFSWPRIANAESYTLSIMNNGECVFETEVEEATVTVEGLEVGFYTWTVTAHGDDCVADERFKMHFSVIEDNGVPVIKDARAAGNTIVLAYDKAEEGYIAGSFNYQIKFYSLTTSSWTDMTQVLEVANGQAIIDLGVNASNGYLYIRPITTPESTFVEIYLP